MKLRPLSVLAFGLVAGAVAFGSTYWWRTREHRDLLASPGSELAWLRHEFRLTDDQFSRVTKLHTAYQPTCAELCRRIAEQNRRLHDAVLATNAVTPEITALVAETGRVRDACRAAMLAHLYAVAREMAPEEGRRYLNLMLTKTCVLQAPRSIDSALSGHDDHALHEHAAP